MPRNNILNQNKCFYKGAKENATPSYRYSAMPVASKRGTATDVTVDEIETGRKNIVKQSEPGGACGVK